jgi:hypothetical protein
VNFNHIPKFEILGCDKQCVGHVLTFRCALHTMEGYHQCSHTWELNLVGGGQKLFSLEYEGELCIFVL